MAAQRAGRGGRTYTPKSGPFAGTTFSSDYRYREAVAIYKGFPGVAQQRKAEGTSWVVGAREMLQTHGELSAAEARKEVSRFLITKGFGGGLPAAPPKKNMGTNRSRKRKAEFMAWAWNNGYMDNDSRTDYEDSIGS